MSPEELHRTTLQVNVLVTERVYAIAGVEGVKHFKKSFTDEGFTDKVLEKWEDITDVRKKQKRRGKKNASPPILTEEGDLRDSIEWEANNAAQQVSFSSDLDYAEAHNEGLDGMPQRQFMGDSEMLMDKIEAKLDRELNRIFNS